MSELHRAAQRPRALVWGGSGLIPWPGRDPYPPTLLRVGGGGNSRDAAALHSEGFQGGTNRGSRLPERELVQIIACFRPAVFTGPSAGRFSGLRGKRLMEIDLVKTRKCYFLVLEGPGGHG